jgi:hypothetical protein
MIAGMGVGMQRPVVLSLLLLMSACGEAVRAPLTIVVDTDRARALEDQGKLQELRVGVQGDRAVLEAARGELHAARLRLENASQGNAVQRAQALAEVRALEARVASDGGAGVVTRAELDAALAAHEGRLAAIIAAELDRARQPTPATASPVAIGAALAVAGSPVHTASEVRGRLVNARATLAAKGLVVADVAGGTASVDRMTSALEQGEIESAFDVAVSLGAAADVAVLDINTLVKREGVNADRRTRAEPLLREAASALSSSKFAAANDLLNEVAALLGP